MDDFTLDDSDSGDVIDALEPVVTKWVSSLDERLHMLAKGAVTGRISGTILNMECIWDQPDSRGYNWYQGMRSSPLVNG